MSEARPDPNRQPAKIAAGGVKKGKNQGLKVVTANDLLTGEVVYYTLDRQWSVSLDEAHAVEGQEALNLLTEAALDEGSAVGPYLMDVKEDLTPSGRGRLRELIRETGPSIHPEFARAKGTVH
jgi:hypothetical protein